MTFIITLLRGQRLGEGAITGFYMLPVLSPQALAVFGSGALFGAVFLSVVASTTALVRHNLPAAAWPRDITGFTTVSALGQLIGPRVVGRQGQR
ncbi:YbfB/YjiJ family MFS transporter [Pseudaquabacterium pictum]|uniref:Uncharacterized protein n=1 Tax=Pseudaquabacterium pictum TaxID=2315236 RepID=A0A480AR16_9BURK|nr:YbfB/YjiJ family MFS transporter [Rubrivivax pictus]GCL63841.1 hypothetical protein AQPW35_29220 [Rubrivivax pictus]